MNNNIERINKGLAEICKECISIAAADPSTQRELLRGGGCSGGLMARLLMPRPLNSVRISEDALAVCLEHNITAYDYFILSSINLAKKHGKFFKSNAKTVQECHEVGQYVAGEHNPPNAALLESMKQLYANNPNAAVGKYREILKGQSYDLITVEENERLNKAGLRASGTKEERDALCSPKIEFTDLWLTPPEVIDKFFELSGLNKSECLDPCASDGRWLGTEGYSIDILPMKSFVHKQNFLTLTKEQIPDNIKHIVGNLPFSLLDEFVEKSLELCDDCYFLVNGDTIFNHFPDNIEHIYIFSGLEGNQADNRSRCEFDVPFLFKSALWCCIVHITKEKQPKWTIETNLSNEERRDGYHIALGRNAFIKSACLVDENEHVSRIPVTSSIIWKGGKKIIQDGEILDLKSFNNCWESESEYNE